MRYLYCAALLIIPHLPECLLAQVASPVAEPARSVAKGFPGADSAQVLLFLHSLTDSMHREGFLEYAADSIRRITSGWEYGFHQGPRYRWGKIQIPRFPPDFTMVGVDATTWRELIARMPGTPATQASRDRLLAGVGGWFNDRGYPFTRVDLDILRAEQGWLEGSLRINLGDPVILDTLLLKGERPISPRFLVRYLNLRKGMPFSGAMPSRIASRVQALPYLELLSATPVLRGREMDWVLDLKKRPASRFDFLIGLLPGATTRAGGTLLTGTLEGEFLNAFALGERIHLLYERLRPETQRLDLALRFPFILGSPLGLDGRFSLYKRDTSFLNVDQSLGFLLQFQGADFVQVYLESSASRLIGLDEEAIRQSGELPDQLDMRQRGIGISFSFNRTDYPLNPRLGWSLQTRFSGASRRILTDARLEALGFAASYRDMERQLRLRLHAEGHAFFPLGKWSAFHVQASTGLLGGNGRPLRNEGFRLGGNQNLRGFDEEAFLVRRFTLVSMAYKMLIGKNSNIYTFFNQAFTTTFPTSSLAVDWPFGLGAGMQLETAAGLFGFSIAAGSNRGQPLSRASPKIHLGFRNLF